MTGPADTAAQLPVVRSEDRFAGGVIGVRTDWVRMPTGAVVARDVVVHPGAVGVIALDDDDRVLLLRQYRHPPGRLLWEPPAGLLDHPGEPALQTARRELYEEAGLRAEHWWLLVDTFTSPGMSDEALRVFLARGLTPVPEAERFVGEHEEADLPQTWVPLDRAVELALAGALHNPIALVGVLGAAAARAAGWRPLRPAGTPWPERPAGAGSRG